MYITESLIEQIKDNTSTEFAQGRFSQQTVIDLCNQESVKRIKPLVSGLSAEFFVITTTQTLASGTKKVRLPKRAASRGVRDLYIKNGSQRYQLVQVTREVGCAEDSDATGLPATFYFEADSIVFNLTTDAEYDLVLVLEISPGQLVLSSAVTTISSVDFETGVVVLAGTPTDYGNTVPYDFVEQLGYGNAVLGVEATPTSIVGTTYTFDPDLLPSTLKVGDYVTLAGQTCIPNMPDEAVIVLIHAVSARIFRFRGNYQAAQAEQLELQQAIIYLERALADRAEGQRTTLRNTNSLLRGPKIRRVGY